VHLAGYSPAPPRFYRAMDLFALSSDTEQMPVCLLEAMGTGLPVASTDVGDIRAVLPPEQAPFLVPLDGQATAAGLSQALGALARDPAMRRRLGQLNRRRVEESFSFTRSCAPRSLPPSRPKGCAKMPGALSQDPPSPHAVPRFSGLPQPRTAGARGGARP
jgi:glycosyltransferase involved in cell wall biosynthesis